MRSLFRAFQKPAAPTVPAGQRVYAIGDVHGRLDLLHALLDLIHSDNAARGAAETHVLLLGDMVDRGPASAGVIARVMAGDPRFASLKAIKGNHEASLLSVLAGETKWLRSWLAYGGKAALRSWGVDTDDLDPDDLDGIARAARAAVPAEQRQWLRHLPTRAQAGDYLFVHAGVRPGVALDRQSDDDLLWIRDAFLSDRSDHGAVIVHGHTISRDPEVRPNRIGIDTGAYLSGTLTAVGLEGSDRWFVATAPA